MHNKIFAFIAAIVFLTFGATTGASAAADTLQQEVDQILEQYPGGTQIGPGKISWNSGEAILTLEGVPSTYAVGSCATGYFCAYSGSSRTGSQLSFSSCTATNSTAPIAPVRSIANGRTSGTIWGYNGGSAVVSVAASSSVNTSATITRLGC